MFVYKNLYQYFPDGSWTGAAQVAPFYSNIFMPFKDADRLEISNIALNNLLIQRDDVSIYSVPDQQYGIFPNPANLDAKTDSFRNEFTEYNCCFDQQTAEGGDISFDGEAIEAVVVRRSSNRSNFFIWEDIAILPITTGSLYTLNTIIYDPYIEHGIEYQYAIQPIGRTGRGAQYETLKNTASYGDIWLIGSDTKQLMMGYNSVVSGYKYIVKDAAIETIGSKYPYVVRNANVGYTQFQYSCIITAHMNIVGDKEVFTPFQDIEILDEYKGVSAIDKSTGTSGGSDSTLDPWIRPVDPEAKPVITKIGAQLASIYTEDGREIYSAKFGDTFETNEVDLPGSLRKIKVPIEGLPSTVEPTNFWPIGFNEANPWEEDYLIGYVKEIDCNPLLPGEIPEQGSGTDKSANPTVGEVEFRRMSFNQPIGQVNQTVTLQKTRAAADETVSSKGDLVVGGELQEPDKVYMLEREFRRRVMEFVYDGKPKIFKSPTEGLLLVKLTDISLTPNTTLGRMIYDFSCTMTEIGKIDASSLAKYGFREALGNMPIITKPEEEVFGDEEVAQLYGLFAK